jgi:hypothetical protein
MEFHIDTIHKTQRFFGIQDGTVLIEADSSNPVTIESIHHSMLIGGDFSIECGDKELAIGWNWDEQYHDEMFAICTEDVEYFQPFEFTETFVSINYLPYNVHEYAGTIIETPEPFTVLPTYTFGEMTLALILVPAVLLILYKTILQAFRKPIQFHK